MSTLREEIKRIWLESFNDSAEYVDMYFDRVYRDSDALTMDDASGRPLSSLLLQRYSLWLYGSEQPLAYIAGAATRRHARGNGLMTGLLHKALGTARSRGDMAVALIPASDSLYFFYDRMGFATVFYHNVERYTAGHQFPGPGEWNVVADPFEPRVAEAFMQLERALPVAAVLHSERDFLNILDDLNMDSGGRFVAVEDSEGQVAAMAWSVTDERQVRVKAVLSRDSVSRLAALREIRRHNPGLPFIVEAVPGDVYPRKLDSRGMMRIVDVPGALSAMAAAYPDLRLTVRVHDPLLAPNSGIYHLEHGGCTRLGEQPRKLDFDVNVTVLTQLMFSSPAVGEITGMPAIRPYMTLMLD